MEDKGGSLCQHCADFPRLITNKQHLIEIQSNSSVHSSIQKVSVKVSYMSVIDSLHTWPFESHPLVFGDREMTSW